MTFAAAPASGKMTAPMLRELFVQNLALIEDVRVELRPGFCAWTGQTGAGKTLLLEALGLLLGERGSAELLRAGSEELRITGWVRMPEAISASADGALVYDSAGGEPLAIRLIGAEPKWRQFTLYRKVPATGTINVTMALTGIGTAYFDDVRIEPLQTAAR